MSSRQAATLRPDGSKTQRHLANTRVIHFHFTSPFLSDLFTYTYFVFLAFRAALAWRGGWSVAVSLTRTQSIIPDTAVTLEPRSCQISGRLLVVHLWRLSSFVLPPLFSSSTIGPGGKLIQYQQRQHL